MIVVILMEELFKRLNIEPRDMSLYKNAFSHSSYVNEHKAKNDYERLEFLGDAVLELISSEYIYKDNPTNPEGDLTRIRASYVCEPTLALCAREMKLGDYILLGKGEDLTGGRERDSILSDTLEATIGAIYLDGGFERAKEYIQEFILHDIDKKKLFYDSKTILQEIVQSEKLSLEYKLLAEEGPDHNKSFTVAVDIDGREFTTATGRTKKKAEQSAAYQAILKLGTYKKGDN